MRKIRIGVFGAAGYAGGELLRLLTRHPAADLVFAHSRSHAGQAFAEVFPDMLGDTALCFTSQVDTEIDLLFLCLAHGEAAAVLATYAFADSVSVVDLSQDFRLQAGAEAGFVYGLPELNRTRIQSAKRIANPGCFATAVQLALLPLAAQGLMPAIVHVNATTGSTGAGRSLSETAHFSWRHNNLSVYKAFTHQHLKEIQYNLGRIQPQAAADISMVPQRGSFTRGIMACLTLETDADTAHLEALYDAYYSTHPFTHVSRREIDLKQVVNTNKCVLYIEKQGRKLLLLSVIDNLLKGAAGQAVQNMNLMFGLEESTGLLLKASAY